MSLIGQTLGQFHIVEFIGAGGMASVYKAYQPNLDRYVAVKVLPAQHALTPGFKERFILEARAVAQLSHPNILPIYDFGVEDDLSYFVMKYVPDLTLSNLMGQPMKLNLVSHFIDQVASALDHAHARGILHRDIKPANMLLEGDWLLLADFGVAKIVESNTIITSTGHVFGSPAYVSPEQAEGNPLDQRTDIYSLGVVLYQMVVGRVPYQDTNPMRVIFKHIHEPPPTPRSVRPDLSEAVEQVILTAMAKDPAKRYDSAAELAEALRQAVALAAQGVEAPAPAISLEEKVGEVIPAPSTQPIPVAAPKSSLLEASRPAVAPRAPLPRSRQSVPNLGMTIVAGALLLLMVVGVLFLFSGDGNAEGPTPAETAPPQVSPTAVSQMAAPTLTLVPATSTPLPPAEVTPTLAAPAPTAVTPAPITPAPTATLPPAETTIASSGADETVIPTPEPQPAIEGILAIPVKFGSEFKVYLTGFDGAGMNGPAPISVGNARQPRFRPDGQALLVNGTDSGALRGIFTTGRQGQAPAPLNDRGDGYWPVWSPDGATIAFVDLNQNRTLVKQSSQLARSESDYVPLQANNAKLIGNNLVWSDDNHLVFQGCAEWAGQAGECGIWVMDTAVMRPVRLTSDSGLPLDAKKGWLLYMLPTDGDWDIYLLSLAGGQPVNLTNNSYQDGLGALAPDGRSVAYISNESGNWAVWTITLRDKQKQKWFDFDPQRGIIDLNSWSEEHMSWTQ
ncbi:MAG: protein kinase [Anaerolineae bacterium]